MAQYNLVTNIPSVLVIECLLKWLSLKDVCFLDSACCCWKERELLMSLLSSLEFIVAQVTIIDDSDLTQWLLKRSIRIKSIKIENAIDGAELSKYLSLCGMHVRSVHFIPNMDSAISKIILIAIATYCCHLTAFTCMQGYRLSSQKDNFENLLLHNPGLVLLELERVELVGIALQGIALPKLRQLKFTHSYLNNTLFEVLSVSIASQIERLDLSFTDCEVQQIIWCSFRNLRALQLVDCQFINDQHLQSIALNCSQLIHLCLDGCTSITDVGMRDIAMNLAQLRSLDIRYCKHLTDRSLQCLILYCASHLETIYFDVLFYSSAVISDLFFHSSYLIEVGFRSSASDSFLLQEWETIFTAAPAIHMLVLDIETALSEFPLNTLALHCQQLRELHITKYLGVIFNDPDVLLSILAGSPQLQVLQLYSALYDAVADTIKVVYPHLAVEMNNSYPFFDALAQPI